MACAVLTVMLRSCEAMHQALLREKKTEQRKTWVTSGLCFAFCGAASLWGLSTGDCCSSPVLGSPGSLPVLRTVVVGSIGN